MMTIEERLKKASQKAETAEKQQRIDKRNARVAERKKDQCRNYRLGELVTKYFPEAREIEPANSRAEDAVRFAEVEKFLAVLASKPDLLKELRAEAASFRLPIAEDEVSGRKRPNV